MTESDLRGRTTERVALSGAARALFGARRQEPRQMIVESGGDKRC